MIQAIQIEPEALTSNIDNINFDKVDLQTRSANCCGWLQYMAGGSEFIIVGGGTFRVTFNANVTSDTAGQVAIALKTGTGTDVEGTEVDAVIATDDEYTNISFSKLIRVCPRTNVVLAVGSLPAIGGVTPAVETEIPTIKDANLSIEKIA